MPAKSWRHGKAGTGKETADYLSIYETRKVSWGYLMVLNAGKDR